MIVFHSCTPIVILDTLSLNRLAVNGMAQERIDPQTGSKLTSHLLFLKSFENIIPTVLIRI